MALDNKATILLKRVISLPESLKDFVEKDFNLLVDNLNSSLDRMSFTRNFESQAIKDLAIPAGGTVRVDHKLRFIPQSRIITRQIGGGAITDGDFTANYIELTNSGGTTAIVSLVLFKE
jgi:hypothetical protein